MGRMIRDLEGACPLLEPGDRYLCPIFLSNGDSKGERKGEGEGGRLKKCTATEEGRQGQIY